MAGELGIPPEPGHHGVPLLSKCTHFVSQPGRRDEASQGLNPLSNVCEAKLWPRAQRSVVCGRHEDGRPRTVGDGAALTIGLRVPLIGWVLKTHWAQGYIHGPIKL